MRNQMWNMKCVLSVLATAALSAGCLAGDLDGEQPPNVADRVEAKAARCAGAHVAPGWVLSAAHCFDAASSSSQRLLAVRLGGEGTGGQVVAVTRILRHPDYDPATLENDLALLELGQPLAPSAAQPTGDDAPNGVIIEYATGDDAPNGIIIEEATGDDAPNGIIIEEATDDDAPNGVIIEFATGGDAPNGIIVDQATSGDPGGSQAPAGGAEADGIMVEI